MVGWAIAPWAKTPSGHLPWRMKLHVRAVGAATHNGFIEYPPPVINLDGDLVIKLAEKFPVRRLFGVQHAVLVGPGAVIVGSAPGASKFAAGLECESPFSHAIAPLEFVAN